MKIRPQMGGLEESLLAHVEIEPTKAAIMQWLADRYEHLIITENDITVMPYRYDPRTKWDTHLVCVFGKAVAFTDGPLEC